MSPAVAATFLTTIALLAASGLLRVPAPEAASMGTVRPVPAAFYAEGAPAGFSGGFKEQSCDACHFHAAVNSGPGRVTIADVPARFVAGERYPLTITLERPGIKLGGFQLTARLKESGAQAGTLAPAPGEDDRLGVEVQGDIQYAVQRHKGTALAAPGTARWSVVWTAPETTGPVVFHVAANAADADGSVEGDYIHTAAVETAPAQGQRAPYPHEGEPIGTVRQSYDGALSPELAVSTFRNIHRLFPSRIVEHGNRVRELPPAARQLSGVSFAHDGGILRLDDYVRTNRVAGLMVLKDGRVALERYEFGNTAATRWMSMSIAKSITSTLVGAAIHDGHIRGLDDEVTRYVPRLAGSAYEGVTIRDVLMMASGVKWSETYTDPSSDRRKLLEAQISQVPGSAMAVMASLPRAAPPGTRNTYSTGETQVIGEVVRGAVGRPLAEYLSERVWKPAGMEADATWWLDSPDGVEIGGSGIGATLRDYARFGQFILEDGVVDGKRVLPEGWTREAGSPKTLGNGRVIDYGYLWWPVTTGAGRRDGAFSAVGIHGQAVYINPAARVVIVVWSAQPKPTGGAVIEDDVVFDAIAAALR